MHPYFEDYVAQFGTGVEGQPTAQMQHQSATEMSIRDSKPQKVRSEFWSLVICLNIFTGYSIVQHNAPTIAQPHGPSVESKQCAQHTKSRSAVAAIASFRSVFAEYLE